MTHGWCYEFLRDQGSLIGGIIAGLLTLLAGVLAYRAGHVQAKATRDSARTQVAAIREQKDQAHEDAVAQIEGLARQIEQRDREAAELQWKEKVEMVRALATESARVHRFATDRLLLAEKHYSKTPDQPILREVAPFRIEAGAVLNKVGVLDFRGTGIMPAATHLKAMVDILVSALDSAGTVSELNGGALIGHLNNVITAAQQLKARLEKWEIDNPVSQ